MYALAWFACRIVGHLFGRGASQEVQVTEPFRVTRAPSQLACCDLCDADIPDSEMSDGGADAQLIGEGFLLVRCRQCAAKTTVYDDEPAWAMSGAARPHKTWEVS